MLKRSVSAAMSEPQFPESTWTPAKIRFGAGPRDVRFLLLVVLSVAWSWQALVVIIGRSLQSSAYEHYSHIILLPFFSAYLLYLNRDRIFSHVQTGWAVGVPVMLVGVATSSLARFLTAEPEDRLALTMLGLLAFLVGAFALCYGSRALKVAAFPFILLLFMVPLPPTVLDAIVVFLQKTSAEGSAVLFAVIGMPVLRDGVFFALPGINIEVAKECSGIRSSLALVISGLVMSYLLLRKTWTRTAFILVIVPLAIAKNAVRIVALSWLAVHVDPSFITGSAVHRNGGIPVFLTSLAILGSLAWLLRKCELRRST